MTVVRTAEPLFVESLQMKSGGLCSSSSVVTSFPPLCQSRHASLHWRNEQDD